MWNRLYDPATVARDTAVKTGLRDLGFECESHNANLLHEPWEIRTGQGGPYRVFTPFWRACQMRLDAQPAPLPAPGRLHGPSQPDRQPGAGRARPAAEDSMGRSVFAVLVARRKWCASAAGEILRRMARPLRRRPQSPGPAREFTTLTAPAFWRDQSAPVPGRGAQRHRRAAGGREIRRQFHPRDRLARIRVSPAAPLPAHARASARRTLRTLSVG